VLSGECSRLVLQVAEAMVVLHDMGVLHLDLKPTTSWSGRRLIGRLTSSARLSRHRALRRAAVTVTTHGVRLAHAPGSIGSRVHELESAAERLDRVRRSLYALA